MLGLPPNYQELRAAGRGSARRARRTRAAAARAVGAPSSRRSSGPAAAFYDWRRATTEMASGGEEMAALREENESLKLRLKSFRKSVSMDAQGPFSCSAYDSRPEAIECDPPLAAYAEACAAPSVSARMDGGGVRC